MGGTLVAVWKAAGWVDVAMGWIGVCARVAPGVNVDEGNGVIVILGVITGGVEVGAMDVASGMGVNNWLKIVAIESAAWRSISEAAMRSSSTRECGYAWGSVL